METPGQGAPTSRGWWTPSAARPPRCGYGSPRRTPRTSPHTSSSSSQSVSRAAATRLGAPPRARGRRVGRSTDKNAPRSTDKNAPWAVRMGVGRSKWRWAGVGGPGGGSADMLGGGGAAHRTHASQVRTCAPPSTCPPSQAARRCCSGCAVATRARRTSRWYHLRNHLRTIMILIRNLG
jgi:hypothetical protein